MRKRSISHRLQAVRIAAEKGKEKVLKDLFASISGAWSEDDDGMWTNEGRSIAHRCAVRCSFPFPFPGLCRVRAPPNVTCLELQLLPCAIARRREPLSQLRLTLDRLGTPNARTLLSTTSPGSAALTSGSTAHPRY